jgi:hypothetical protein
MDREHMPSRHLVDRRDRVAGVMIPAAHLDRWAERQADYMAEIRRRAWMREHMPELIDEGEDW